MDIQAVSNLIEEAAYTLLLPRLSRLSVGDVQAKMTPGDPEDVVTIVDRQVETYLTEALAALAPSAAVIGDEATHQQPELLQLLASDRPLWVIDPIDGTKNFAAGDSGFGIMVAYVVKGEAQVAWLVLPARRETFIAEAGSGAFLNGERIRVAPARNEGRSRGAVLVRYMPGALGDAVVKALRGHVDICHPSGCAAVEYTDILRGVRDFVVYYRLLPWDHAAPALVLTEAGGRVAHADGRPYRARSESQVTMIARDTKVADRLRMWLGPYVPTSPGLANTPLQPTSGTDDFGLS